MPKAPPAPSSSVHDRREAPWPHRLARTRLFSRTGARTASRAGRRIRELQQARPAKADAQGLVELACECTKEDCERSVKVPLYVYRRMQRNADQLPPAGRPPRVPAVPDDRLDRADADRRARLSRLRRRPARRRGEPRPREVLRRRGTSSSTEDRRPLRARRPEAGVLQLVPCAPPLCSCFFSSFRSRFSLTARSRWIFAIVCWRLLLLIQRVLSVGCAAPVDARDGSRARSSVPPRPGNGFAAVRSEGRPSAR